VNLAGALTKRSVILSDGRIVCDMPTKDLLADSTRLREMKLLFD
jgi:hypothetical protein